MADQMNGFISYAHEDEALCKELEKYLNVSRRELAIFWSDKKISAGEEWDKVIRQRLKDARVILLLISIDFMNSDYIERVEAREAMERHEKGEALVIPIILRRVPLEDTPYSKLKALPEDAKPVNEWDIKEQAFVNIIEGIKAAIKNLDAMQAATKSLSESRKEEMRFHETLLKLDYEEQKRAFRPFHASKDKKYLGAFIIYGPPDHGQVWLVNRLIKAAEIENVDKGPFMFSFTAKGSSREPKQLWSQMCQWLNINTPLHPTEAIIEQVYKLWQRQSVILKIRGIQNTRQEDIEAFLHTFWEPLMQMIAERASQGQKSPNHYLLLFFIDNQGEVEQWKSNWKEQFETPAIPVKLKEIQEFKDRDIEVWIEGNKDDLPDTLQLDNALAKGKIPEDALEQICTVCGYEWSNQEGANW